MLMRIRLRCSLAKTYQYDANNNLIAPLNASVVAKAEGYKTGKEADKTNAEVGDLVTYTVRTTVPYHQPVVSVLQSSQSLDALS